MQVSLDIFTRQSVSRDTIIQTTTTQQHLSLHMDHKTTKDRNTTTARDTQHYKGQPVTHNNTKDSP